MKLHRAATKPDWELVRPAGRNRWQQLAARTGGVVTPGNLASTLGICLVGAGLVYIGFERLWAGLALLAAGRLCDLLDGTAAERTGTKSPLGEAVDASLDKIAALAALVVFTAAGVLPWPFALAIGLQNLPTSALAVAAKSRKHIIHPVAAGKVGGAVEWVALLGFVLGHAPHASFAHDFIMGAYGLAVVSIILGIAAAAWYAWIMRTQGAEG